jgi:organic hydroperoxide reductase OsmC/OhrA
MHSACYNMFLGFILHSSVSKTSHELEVKGQVRLALDILHVSITCVK